VESSILKAINNFTANQAKRGKQTGKWHTHKKCNPQPATVSQTAKGKLETRDGHYIGGGKAATMIDITCQ